MTTPDATLMADLEAARDRLRRLEAERTSLPERITEARHGENAAQWMMLLNREDSLPAEIREARIQLLPLDLEAAWREAELLHDAEAEIAADLASEQAELKDLRKTVPPLHAQAEMAEHAAVIARKAAHAAGVEQRHREAQDATGSALLRVDELEAAVTGSGGDLPDDGTGLRARPRVLTANVSLTPDVFGALADHLDELNGGARFLPSGTAPPRWVAHRLGDHVYEQRVPVGQPTLEDIEKSRRRQRELDAAEVGIEGRLTPGKRQHREMLAFDAEERRRRGLGQGVIVHDGSDAA